jgi:acetate kinase
VSAPGGLRVLCVNAGSSSLKLALFDVDATGDPRTPERALWRSATDGVDIGAALDALDVVGLPAPDAVGHRVVHGGTRHTRPVLVEAGVLDDLRDLVPLAPLHQPAAIAGIEAMLRARPGLPQVVCFDTAFHHTMPEAAARLPLPRSLWDQGIRRYGFHGLSYESVVDHVGAGPLGRAVIAHLGNGASMCAVRDGRSIDTTMAFTPTGGIVMGTRTGDLDPGVLVHLLAGSGSEPGLDLDAIARLVTHEGGLLGLSGTTSDMRDLLAARDRGDVDAALAVTVFCRTVRKQVGAYAALLGGLDTLVFTGGIGEHSAAVRAEVCDGLDFLGITIDADRNQADRHQADRRPGPVGEVVSPPGSPVTVLAVATDEDRMIARHTARLVAL